jgi:hypothetical protein
MTHGIMQRSVAARHKKLNCRSIYRWAGGEFWAADRAVKVVPLRQLIIQVK